MSIPETCSHGINYDDPCLECERVSLREELAYLVPKVERKQKRLVEIEAQLTDRKE